MRDTLFVLLALLMVCLIVFTCAAADTPAAPRRAAWWSLLFPGLFSPDTSVTFTWPLVDQVLRFFRLCG